MPIDLTCYGTCSGTTPLLCKSDWDMYCGVGVEMDVKELVPQKLKGGMEKLGRRDRRWSAWWANCLRLGIELVDDLGARAHSKGFVPGGTLH